MQEMTPEPGPSQEVVFSRQTAVRLGRAIRNVATSEVAKLRMARPRRTAVWRLNTTSGDGPGSGVISCTVGLLYTNATLRHMG